MENGEAAIGFKKNFSILECKSVQELKKLGNNKADWKEWLYQLKNVLRPVLGQDRHWEFWMGIAERNHMNSGELESLGDNDDEHGVANVDYEWTGQSLKALMINSNQGQSRR